MKENDIYIIKNEGINRLIHEIFVSINENALVDEIYEDVHDVKIFMMYFLLIRHKNSYAKALTQVSPLLFYC